MGAFPRTTVGGESVSRMIVGTNWFLGWSHATDAKDQLIRDLVRERTRIAEILAVFFAAGVDTVMGPFPHPPLLDAVHDAEQRTGVKAVIVSTPSFPTGPRVPSEGFDLAEVDRVLDEQQAIGVRVCMPHQSTTDALIDRCTRTVRHADQLCAGIRARGMVPGLASHMPEAVFYADDTGLDVETYISIFNCAGFLMQIEVDWTAQIIAQASRPVMTIKPLAAGQVRPFQGLTFAWNTIRDIDMVTVGTMSAREAQECIDLSVDILERRGRGTVRLQETRSKQSVKRVLVR
jgi:hypothetical protein